MKLSLDQSVKFSRTDIYFSDSGKGKTIVLLHGFLESSEIWNRLPNDFSDPFRIVAIDLPGHGKSGTMDDLSMEKIADSVKAVLDYCDIEQCLMVGHSMGGYAALAFAEKYPDLLKGLVLFHSQAAADTEEAKMNRTRTIRIVTDDRAGFITSFIPDLFARASVSKFSEAIEDQKSIAHQTSNEGIIAALKAMKERNDSRTLLENLKVPVLFIAGKEDKRIPVGLITTQAALPRHAELLLLSGVGHMGFIEAPEIIFPALKCFAKRVL